MMMILIKDADIVRLIEFHFKSLSVWNVLKTCILTLKQENVSSTNVRMKTIEQTSFPAINPHKSTPLDMVNYSSQLFVMELVSSTGVISMLDADSVLMRLHL